MKGDMGPGGAVGGTGEKGERGEAGPSGVMGEKGERGEAGGGGVITWNQCSWANLNLGLNYGLLAVGSGQGAGVLIRAVSCYCVS